MQALTPIERAVSKYCAEWSKSPIDRSGIAEVNPETLSNATQAEFRFQYIDISSVVEGSIDWSSVKTLRFADAPSRARRLLRNGDTMICTVRPLLMSHAFFGLSEGKPTVCSTGFAVIRSNQGLSSSFLRHLPFAEQVTQQLIAWQCGTNYPAVNERDVRRLIVPVPPPDEQAAIARILDAVDTALERNRAAVERARELRHALLQAFFGFIGSTEAKKNSDVGRIPESWDAIKGRQAFVIVTGGCSSVDALKMPRDGRMPDSWFMKVDDFNDPANRRAIVRTKIGFRSTENCLFKVLPYGTIVIAKRGAAIMKNRVRTTAVPVSLDPNLMALQALPGIQPEFLRLQLEWRNLSRYVENSGVPQLNNKDLYPRYFLRPPDEQQNEIIRVVAAAEKVEDSLLDKLDVQQQLKKSLMYDLLTGQVRVRVDPEETAS